MLPYQGRLMIAILQIGDIHTSEKKANPALANAGLVVAAIKTLAASCSELYLVLTGDIAYAGKQKEYEIATTFIGELEEGLRNLGNPGLVGTVVIPGNHDCDFDIAGDLRDAAMASVGAAIEALAVHGNTAAELVRPQTEYFNFQALIDPRLENTSRLYWQRSFSAAKSKVLFRALNTAWVSRRHEVPGQLFFPPQAILPIEGDTDLVVTLMHHPFAWIEPNNARLLRREIETSSDIILTGHEHKGDSYGKILSDGAQTNYVEGAAFYDPQSSENGFNLIILDPPNSTYQVNHFLWKGSLYEAQPPTSRIFTRNQNLLEHQFLNNPEFRQELDDIGTPFTHTEKTELKLSDLFVYPDLRAIENSPSARTPQIVRGHKVLQFVVDNPKLRISGPTKSGRTSLAKVLYKDLLEQKKIVPVLISGSDFKGTTYESVVGVITRNFKRQYSDKLYSRFSQLLNNDRICIIDDWQQFSLNFAAKEAVLSALLKYGSRVLVFADAAASIYELGQLAKNDDLADFAFCEMKELGYVLRGRLVSNWISLGKEFQLDELELTERSNAAEHVLDTLISTGIVPSYPFFVLSVLQARDSAGSTTNYGSFGHIYEQLLTTRLGHFGQKRVGAKLTFLSRIAFAMHQARTPFIRESELHEAADLYSREYALSERVSQWIEQFVEAKILQIEQGEVKFIYKYAYYFLLALYFQEGISNAYEAEDLKRQLIEMVDGAYDDDKTQTLIFYLYLSKDRQLIEQILAKARGVLAETAPIDLTRDLAFSNSLCSRHPTLIAPGTNHSANRLARDTQKDEVAEVSREPNKPNGSHQIAVATGFQLLDIMGQVVRNFPLELRADQKRELVYETCALGLRMMKDFMLSMENGYEDVSRALRDFLERNPVFTSKSPDDVAYASNMFLVNFIEGMLIGMIKKISFCIGLRELAETYRQIEADTSYNDVSMRIIDLAITLEHFAKIPASEVERLRAVVESNITAYTILRTLVSEFLSLFPCDYKLRQRMESLLKFEPNDPRLLLDKKVRSLTS